METRDFHLGDLLSFTTGALISPTHMSGVSALAEFMTGGPVWTHQLVILFDPIKAEILFQYPELASIEFDLDLTDVDRDVAEQACADWLSVQVEAEGREFYALSPFPPGTQWSNRNPIQDAVDLMGSDRVVHVVVSD